MKRAVGIYAHPDDESLMGGTLAMLASKIDVYLICVTNGDAGRSTNTNSKELANLRQEELLRSAKFLGIKKVFFLGINDGAICNNVYHKIASKLEKILKEIKPDVILTYGPNGISGHLDHIAISFIATYVYKKMIFLKEIWYFVITKQVATYLQKGYFIYVPEGYKKSEITKTINVGEVWEQKRNAMYAHKSQMHDIEKLLNKKATPEEENFIIKRKR